MSQPGENRGFARRRLDQGLRRLQEKHRAGLSAIDLCAAISDLRDEVVAELFDRAVDRGGRGGELRGQVALVAHGGYGRRDVAPYSDVDLMLLHRCRLPGQVQRLAQALWCEVCDAGLVAGHSVRTPQEACRLAGQDPAICTSLMESRLVAGEEGLFRQFTERFARSVRARATALITAIDRHRREERVRFGETVYLLEPDVKRSRGGLRDLQLVRWIGLVRYGQREPGPLVTAGVLSREDGQAIRGAAERLLWLRNELHFHAGRAADILSRAEQCRIAGLLRYQPGPGLLPVERFMRDYFRHTGQVSHVATRLVAKARQAGRRLKVGALFGHRVPGGFYVGPTSIRATRQGLARLRGSLIGILQLVGLASLHDKAIAPETWDQVRRQAACLPPDVPPEAWQRFHRLLDHPSRLGPLLRGLHEVGVLEKFIPAFTHARGLLQFNQYHKYTVDEHCIRAVEEATELQSDPGPLGVLYRGLRRKALLHLALLIHDVGKGSLEDHSEVGLRIARQIAERMRLDEPDADVLRFLVHNHLLMNHLAFRRDTSDERLLVRFALQVGSPEVLGMLLLLTACDLAAVGPGTWTGWKAEVLTDLYARTMRHLAEDMPAFDWEEALRRRRQAALDCLGTDAHHPWFVRHVEALSKADLSTATPRQLADDLKLLHGLAPGQVRVQCQARPDSGTIEFTVSTSEQITPGIFHKLTGALTAQGLEILSARIRTLQDGLVLDRFLVLDPDYAGQSPPDRLEEIRTALEEALRAPPDTAPRFRRRWPAASPAPAGSQVAETRVQADNSTSESYTILDIFAVDRPGLLYDIARTLFDLDLCVWRAKIGTYLDQVVDAFYVTDGEGKKIQDATRLQQIRGRLLEVILELETSDTRTRPASSRTMPRFTLPRDMT